MEEWYQEASKTPCQSKSGHAGYNLPTRVAYILGLLTASPDRSLWEEEISSSASCIILLDQLRSSQALHSPSWSRYVALGTWDALPVSAQGSYGTQDLRLTLGATYLQVMKLREFLRCIRLNAPCSDESALEWFDFSSHKATGEPMW